MQNQPPIRPQLVPWIYDLLLHVFSACLDIFFREVYPRSTWRIPKRGAVIVVAAPHANQFVDSVLLMRILKQHAGRRVSFLTAEKSLREPYIGPLASRMGALPVARAMDNVRPGKGEVFLADPAGDTTLLHGRNVDFTTLSVGSLIILPKSGNESPEQQAIAGILGPEELRLKGPFMASKAGEPLHEQLLAGTAYKVAPHVDQSEMYDAVFRSLSDGGCVGIFPEGGSHDRPSLLPLKAGVAIIALGALARDPDLNLTILPCGLSYFNPHKFRSRAVVEFGDPVKVSPDQVAAFKQGKEVKREAVGALLQTIQDALAAVTQQAPDYETLALVQATRRLYRPLRMKLPLPVVVEMNRKLMAGYTEYKDEPRVVQLKQAVLDYNRKLRALGIKDHQVEWGNAQQKPAWLALLTLLYRCGQLLTLGLATLPSLALFWPIFLTTKIISTRKQRAALANSVVKLKGRDVVSTWKILVAMGLAPTLYCWYAFVVTLWLHHCRHGGYYASLAPWAIRADTYVSGSIPLQAFSVAFFGLLIAISFAGLRFGEIGVDAVKSLRPLLVILRGPSSGYALRDVRTERQRLAARVVEVVRTFGSETFRELGGEDRADMGGFSHEHPDGLSLGGSELPAKDHDADHNLVESTSTDAHLTPNSGSSSARTGFVTRERVGRSCLSLRVWSRG
jgi:glycerol-3-phosphate O-acyltransferase/dihydroxyacetone phosphate acyltransferase